LKNKFETASGHSHCAGSFASKRM